MEITYIALYPSDPFSHEDWMDGPIKDFNPAIVATTDFGTYGYDPHIQVWGYLADGIWLTATAVPEFLGPIAEIVFPTPEGEPEF